MKVRNYRFTETLTIRLARGEVIFARILTSAAKLPFQSYERRSPKEQGKLD